MTRVPITIYIDMEGDVPLTITEQTRAAYQIAEEHMFLCMAGQPMDYVYAYPKGAWEIEARVAIPEKGDR